MQQMRNRRFKKNADEAVAPAGAEKAVVTDEKADKADKTEEPPKTEAVPEAPAAVNPVAAKKKLVFVAATNFGFGPIEACLVVTIHPCHAGTVTKEEFPRDEFLPKIVIAVCFL